MHGSSDGWNGLAGSWCALTYPRVVWQQNPAWLSSLRAYCWLSGEKENLHCWLSNWRMEGSGCGFPALILSLHEEIQIYMWFDSISTQDEIQHASCPICEQLFCTWLQPFLIPFPSILSYCRHFYFCEADYSVFYGSLYSHCNLDVQSVFCDVGISNTCVSSHCCRQYAHTKWTLGFCYLRHGVDFQLGWSSLADVTGFPCW